MNLPEGIQSRPLTLDDAAEMAVLVAAKAQADRDGENFSAEDLAEELRRPGLDLERDTISLWDGDRLVGYGLARVSQTVVDVDRVQTDGAVHPDRRGRGLGTELVQWLIKRAGELHTATHPEAPGVVGAGAVVTNTGATELLTGFGFEPVRYYFDMHRPLDQPVPDVAVADGLRLVTFDPAYTKELLDAHNESFSDHWGFTPRSLEAFQARVVNSRAFRGGQSYYVLDGDTIATYVNCFEYEAVAEATGVRELYVGQVGTRRAYRGRGLARAALAKVLAEAAQAGYQRAGLGVDADNPTGALGLYEKLGFTTHQKFVNYQLAIADGVVHS
ncbi:GNAT family N-acetyltransferase [Kribbella sp.]|uniref:GNAT family N-acetyltransferase n=1 Tax=Kribbella sp. TaxID=1871183 RepID=UPI002D3C6F20|nr:GNAT family N-acetyltransferase [Kribbella sp.]HZX05956.1 GNAT family N-acetyltransferase [Kribbella sp.]